MTTESQKVQDIGSWIEDGDYRVVNHHSIFLFYPQNDEALQNLIDNTDEEAQFLGNALVVEHGFVSQLVELLNNDGWRVV
ncbi:MAG: hypothetical protein VXA34_00430 [Gammaproteobacteria bacterium]|jgi:hypothetical protein